MGKGRIALIADAVTSLAEGGISGVNHYVLSCGRALASRGYIVDVVTGPGARDIAPLNVIEIAGTQQETALLTPRHFYPVPPDSILANYCSYLHTHQRDYDAIINLCHDWLPYYLTSFFTTPLLHIPNLADQNAVTTREINRVAERYPARIGLMSRAQGKALGLADAITVLQAAVDVASYPFSATPIAVREYLIFAARVSPEKGLEEAAGIARQAGLKLHVCGRMDQPEYYVPIADRYGDTLVYRGFLEKTELAQEMGAAKAQLCTHRWVEAFGMVVIEALACGTPVITYDLGAPPETIRDGVTGFVVKDNEAAVAAVAKLDRLQPRDCRQACETQFSLPAFGARLDAWVTHALEAEA